MKIGKEQIHESRAIYKSTIQTTLDDDFNVPDTKADIDNVVNEWGNVNADSIKVNNDKAEVKGSMAFAVLYTGKSDSEGKVVPVKMSGEMNFSEVINLSEDIGDKTAICDARMEDLTIKPINSRKISVKAIIALTVTVMDEQWQNVGCIVEETKEDDNIQINKEHMEYTELSVSVKDNLRVKETVSLPQGKPNIGELLWEDVCIKSFNTRTTDDGILVNGEIGVFVMYDSEIDNQGAIWYETTSAFEEKMDINGTNQDMISFIKYRIVSCNMEAKPNYDGEMRDLNVELVLEMRVSGYNEKEIDVISDIYSPLKQVELKKQQISAAHLLMRNNSRCRASQRIKTGEYADVLQLCCCNGTAQIDDITVQEDGVIVDGAVIANVMYVTADDNMPLASKKTAVPFTHKLQLKTCDKMIYDMEVSTESVNAVMIGKDEVEIKANVVIDMICFENIEKETVDECTIKNYDENEFLKFPSITGYISDGTQSLWDIARNYHTTVDMIKTENKNLPEHCDNSYIVRRNEKLLLVKCS